LPGSRAFWRRRASSLDIGVPASAAQPGSLGCSWWGVLSQSAHVPLPSRPRRGAFELLESPGHSQINREFRQFPGRFAAGHERRASNSSTPRLRSAARAAGAASDLFAVGGWLGSISNAPGGKHQPRRSRRFPASTSSGSLLGRRAGSAAGRAKCRCTPTTAGSRRMRTGCEMPINFPGGTSICAPGLSACFLTTDRFLDSAFCSIPHLDLLPPLQDSVFADMGGGS